MSANMLQLRSDPKSVSVARLHDRIQLLPHLVFAENFRIDAAEAALRAEGELVERVGICSLDRSAVSTRRPVSMSEFLVETKT